MSHLCNISFRGLTLGLLLFLSFSDKAQVKEKDRADSAFLLLKEMYTQSLAKKDQASTAIGFQQTGQISYYLGKAYHLLGKEDSADHYFELSRRANEIVRMENARKITFITTMAIVVVVTLLVILGAVVISRQRLKIRNERLTGERDRQIYHTQRELMQAELQNRQLQEERLIQELEVKRKGLTSSTLHVIQKNQLLENLRDRLGVLVKDDKRDQKKQLQQLIQQINLNFNHDQYWNEFRETFCQVHQQFFDHLKAHCEDLTGNDLRLLSLIKLNLSSGDIAILLGISQDSLRVSRYRLKKKLSLNNGESLTDFVHSL